ncbi:MAG: site-2 protease family protein [Phycisphaerales bacterium]|nr:MAG: site-2 protease family protein [Phycisphaerales bacterium]
MYKSKSYLIHSRLALLVIIAAAIVYFVGGHIRMSWNIFLAVMGFSAVVFIHECGHFFVAKVSKVKVQTFSVFLPPVLLGVRRTENGFRFRILPRFFPKEDDPEGDGLLSFTVGKGGPAGETEYRIGLIPVAGYVKMLGQEDVGADKQVTDPRSFGNKPTGIRMAVIAAGVTFNVIAAVVLMMAVYLIGINRLPAVVGGVVRNSPAARAGLKAGDEIIEIAGKSDDLDYGNILMAAALSDKGEPVPLRVRREDGSEQEYALVAEQMAGMPVRVFGFYRPFGLTIAAVEEADALREKTGLIAGDRVTAVDGQAVQTHWELEDKIRNSFVPAATLVAERTTEAGDTELVEARVPLDLVHADGGIESESDLNHICSIVPRLRITAVATGGISGGTGPDTSEPRKDDVILAVGDVQNPTYKEMREVTEAHEGKELALTVLRKDDAGIEEALTVTVVPKRMASDDRVLIGIGIALDAKHPVVAKTIAAEGGPEPLAIPRGATITAVAGVEVSDFYDCIREIRRHPGESITIDWRLDKDISGEVSLDVREEEGFITARSAVAEFVPFEFMQKLYKADGPLDALVMGSKKSVWFIVQTYATLKQLFARSVSLDAMSGPVGIATMTYKAVEHSFVSFLYLLAFISANLAVINFLPIPVVDGGVFVLLIVEKIKRGPVSIRVQEAISYAGLALIGAVFLYLTYNDILRLILGS